MAASKPLLFAFAACAALCLAAPAAVAKTAPNQAEYSQMDGNNDGVVSSSEHEDYARKIFNAVDADQDGNITAEELGAAEGRLSSYSAGPDGMSPAQVIRRRDTNGDGEISLTEQAAGAAAKFQFLDANHNGELTLQEYSSGG